MTVATTPELQLDRTDEAFAIAVQRKSWRTARVAGTVLSNNELTMQLDTAAGPDTVVVSVEVPPADTPACATVGSTPVVVQMRVTGGTTRFSLLTRSSAGPGREPLAAADAFAWVHAGVAGVISREDER